MFLQVTICVAILAANAASFSYQDANNYIDSVISGKFDDEVHYSRLDPYIFPDIHIDLISKRITDNEANLSKGKLHHLSQVRRSGDCTAPLWTFANISFTCNLRFDQLVVNYTANVTYDNMQLVYYPMTSITDTSITIQITSTPHENIPSLRQLRINAVGKMYVSSKMISIGDVSEMIEEPVRDGIVSSCTINLRKVLNGRFKDVLSYSIYKSPLPFSK